MVNSISSRSQFILFRQFWNLTQSITMDDQNPDNQNPENAILHPDLGQFLLD